MSLTFATLTSEGVTHAQRHGFGDRRVYVSHEAWDELLARMERVVAYDGAPMDVESVRSAGHLMFHGPGGAIKVAPSARMHGDARDWVSGLGLDIGRLIADVAVAGAAHSRRQRRRIASQAARKCGYCGAPGQRVGTRCEYCQVAVSA